MSIDARLNKLMPALSAKERAILLLKSLKDKTPEDPSWRRSMPAEQASEFNGYIGAMNTANIYLSHFITRVEGLAEKLQLRLALQFTLQQWAWQVDLLDLLGSMLVREPITQSEYDALAVQAGQQYVPVADLAVDLAEQRRAWSDDDLRSVDWLRARFVSDAAWKRLCGEAEAELRRSVAAGALVSKGNGKTLRVQRASFDAWRGRPVTVTPEWGSGYDVRPDDQSPAVRSERLLLQDLRDNLTAMPFVHKAEPALPVTAATAGGLAAGMKEVMALCLTSLWPELRSAEIAADELSAQFGGEDVLKPVLRTALDNTRQSLQDVQTYLEAYGTDTALAEPQPDLMDELHAFLDRGKRLLG